MKYIVISVISLCLLGCSVPSTKELITNGDFADGTVNWSLPDCSYGSGASGTFVVENEIAHIAISNPGTYLYNICFMYKETLPMRSGRSYTISLKARATLPKQIELSISEATIPPVKQSFVATVDIGSIWRDISYTFQMPPTSVDAVFSLICGRDMGDVYLDDISILEN